jgi:hypothetical protein
MRMSRDDSERAHTFLVTVMIMRRSDASFDRAMEDCSGIDSPF